MRCKNCNYSISRRLIAKPSEWITSATEDGMYFTIWDHDEWLDRYGSFIFCQSPAPVETEYINLILEKYENI